MGKKRKDTTTVAVAETLKTDTQAERLPLQAEGVTVNGEPVTGRQWLGMNNVLAHEDLFERAPSYLIGCSNMLLGQLASLDEEELKQALRNGMEFKRLPASESRVEDCLAEIVAVCQHYGLPGVGLRIAGWHRMSDAA